MVADMWEPDEQQYAINFVVLSSVGGSVVGPIAGGCEALPLLPFSPPVLTQPFSAPSCSRAGQPAL